MLGETYLHCQAKCHFEKNVKMMFCVAIWIRMSPLTYWNLRSSSKILVLQWLLGSMLVYYSQKVKWFNFKSRLVQLLFIKTQHIIYIRPAVISISNKRNHNQNTKILMFIHYMYVDILFLLKKPIPIMSGRVTIHYQTLWTWIGHNATYYRNTLPYALPHPLPHALQ